MSSQPNNVKDVVVTDKDTVTIDGNKFSGKSIKVSDGMTIIRHAVNKGGKRIGTVDVSLHSQPSAFIKSLQDFPDRASRAMYLVNRQLLADASNNYRSSVGRPVTAGTAINRELKSGNTAFEKDLADLMKKHGILK